MCSNHKEPKRPETFEEAIADLAEACDEFVDAVKTEGQKVLDRLQDFFNGPGPTRPA